MSYYSPSEIQTLRVGGRKLAWILEQLRLFIVAGVTVDQIEHKTRELIAQVGATSATIGYRMDGAPAFPSAVCVSVNDEVVHGIACGNHRVIRNGDLVSVDVVIIYQGLFVDICRTFGIGQISPKDAELLAVARETTDVAIAAAVLGASTDDIGRAAEDCAASYRYQTARELGGHAVGRKIHDKPFIPNYADSGYDDVLEEGMVLAIEPIVMGGDWRVVLAEDQWMFRSRDGKKSAQFEETVLITAEGPEVLTVLEPV